MQPTTIQLIKTSFAKVEPNAGLVATLFYNRLFELDPALRPLFRSDMQRQGFKLMTMLRVVVHGLDRLEDLVSTIEALGERHATYGVSDAHYSTVGAALLGTLAEGLGDGFTPEVEAAWTEAYMILAETMQRGMRRANAASPLAAAA